jgi:hypothetical protein
MVNSAQLKLVLENWWDIQNFETEEALSRLRIGVKRLHLPELSWLRYLATASQGCQKSAVS